MTSSLAEEIGQTIPFNSFKVEVWLNLQRTSAALSHEVERRLRPLGLSRTQYNVLRILRGAGAAGLCQYEVGRRLVAQVPDVPRILDRMDKAGWVRRERTNQDRRLVIATLSPAGAALVDELDCPMQKMIDGMFRGMDDDGLHHLNSLLVMARQTSKRG